jgi:hypothetical protein
VPGVHLELDPRIGLGRTAAPAAVGLEHAVLVLHIDAGIPESLAVFGGDAHGAQRAFLERELVDGDVERRDAVDDFAGPRLQ